MATYKTWSEIKKAKTQYGGCFFAKKEEGILNRVNQEFIKDMMAEDGETLLHIEGIEFTPGGDFVRVVNKFGKIVMISTNIEGVLN